MSDGIEQELDAVVASAKAVLEGRDIYFKEAAAKYLIRELVWSLAEDEQAFLLSSELADHLRIMADNVEADDKAKRAT